MYREYQRQLEEELRERLRQEEQFARERAAQPKPWRPKTDNPERGRLISEADYKNGSNYQAIGEI